MYQAWKRYHKTTCVTKSLRPFAELSGESSAWLAEVTCLKTPLLLSDPSHCSKTSLEVLRWTFGFVSPYWAPNNVCWLSLSHLPDGSITSETEGISGCHTVASHLFKNVSCFCHHGAKSTSRNISEVFCCFWRGQYILAMLIQALGKDQESEIPNESSFWVNECGDLCLVDEGEDFWENSMNYLVAISVPMVLSVQGAFPRLY